MQNYNSITIINYYNKINYNYLLFNFNLSLNYSSTFFIKGYNGIGKTYLIKNIIQFINKLRGYIILNYNNINYILNNKYYYYINNLTIIDLFNNIKNIYNIHIYNYIYYIYIFNLNKNIFINYYKLSSGQQNTLWFIKILLINKYISILDEPINTFDNDNKSLYFYYLLINNYLYGLNIIISHILIKNQYNLITYFKK